MSEDNKKKDEDAAFIKRFLPENELELQYEFSKPHWGSPLLNAELDGAFEKKKKVIIPKGEVYDGVDGNQHVSDGRVVKEEIRNYWKELRYLTPDIRHGNYGPKEYDYVAYMLDLAGSIAALGDAFSSSAIHALRYGAVRVEMSQGKGGWLRETQQTLRKEEYTNKPQSVEKNNILMKKRDR